MVKKGERCMSERDIRINHVIQDMRHESSWLVGLTDNLEILLLAKSDDEAKGYLKEISKSLNDFKDHIEGVEKIIEEE